MYDYIIALIGYKSVSSISIVTGNSIITDDSVPVWLEDLDCQGNEAYIALCPNHGWGAQDCTHDHDVAIKCSGVFWACMSDKQLLPAIS